MRKSYDGLSALVKKPLHEDPASGDLFVFINRKRTQMKVLYFDRSGYCVWSKRLEIDPAMQADLLAALGEELPTPVKPETEKIVYERRKLRSDKTVTDSGLRFDHSVPVETIVLSSPELADVPEDEQVLITEKITYRLAQRPGSYVVLKYVRPVITGQRPGQKHRRCQLSGNGVMNNASVMTCCPVTRSPRPSNMPWPELTL